MSSQSSYYRRYLEATPTWVVAGVCATFLILSLALEKILHKVGHWLHARHKISLLEALEKVKDELMLMGFISLLLTFFQYYIAEICVPVSVGYSMLPCSRLSYPPPPPPDDRRRLLSFERRGLQSRPRGQPNCTTGYVQLLTTSGMHHIHVLIFFLAVFHVIYSALTMFLGRLKIRGWKQWEQETQSHNYEFTNDPSRFRLTHETSFVRTHTSFWTKNPVFFVIGCFFRQFFKSVSKSDYLTLRNGFIAVHLAPGSKFDFQKYIKRSLEDDYKRLVSITPILWLSFCIFLLLNLDGWQTMFWASLIPLVIILAIGTKLQAVLTQMAREIIDRNAVVQGIPLVQGSDKYFWFNRPQMVLSFIHFALFQNAFQLTYFLFIWYQYGLDSCLQDDNVNLSIGKTCLGLGLLILCSYSTLPLYALVAQMGSTMKKSIFDEQTSQALKKWQMAAKKKHGTHHTLGSASPTSPMGSPYNQSVSLHRYRTTEHSTQHNNDGSDLEDQSPPKVTSSLIIRNSHSVGDIHEADHSVDEMRDVDDFSFAKSGPSASK